MYAITPVNKGGKYSAEMQSFVPYIRSSLHLITMVSGIGGLSSSSRLVFLHSLFVQSMKGMNPTLFSPHQLLANLQGRLGSLDFNGNQSKKRKPQQSDLRNRQRETNPLYFSRMHGNSHLITKRNIWRVMISYVLKEHGVYIEVVSNLSMRLFRNWNGFIWTFLIWYKKPSESEKLRIRILF